MELFSSADDAKSFVRLVLEDECHRQSRRLSHFEQGLLALNGEDLIEAQEKLAAQHGVTDHGWLAVEQLTAYLRSARARRDSCAFHPSGKTASELLPAAQNMLDRSTDFVWLIVRDSAHRPFGKPQKVLGAIIACLIIVGFSLLLFLKALRLGGIVLVICVAALLLSAYMLDVYKRRRNFVP